MKILLCSSEVVPFAKTGGLADVAGSLPIALTARGHDVRVAMPKYGSIDEQRFGARQVIEKLKVPLAGKKEQGAVWQSSALPGVVTYLIDNARLFGQGPLYGQPNDPERFVFYQRAILEMLPALDWQPEVIHCNDWQTGLLPFYLQERRAKTDFLAKAASVYTIHNLAYQGNFAREVLQLAELSDDLFVPEKLEFYGDFNFMKAGLLYTDIITTVSPTYAQEIQTAEYGERLEGVLARRAARLRGILNGLDYDIWNPGADSHLAAPYKAEDLKGKAACKQALQARLKLAQAEAPIISLVSRLAAQKGFDLLEEILPQLLKMGVQLVVLGLGEQRYVDLFRNAAQTYPDQVSTNLEFNEELAHQIYAGSDMFLMPSRYEPCGLGQLISLRYGTVPLVRATGGLADTVQDFDPQTGQGNGFSFREYSPAALLAAISRALLSYRDKKVWPQLMKRGLKADFSWQASAAKYEQVYQEAQKLKNK